MCQKVKIIFVLLSITLPGAFTYNTTLSRESSLLVVDIQYKEFYKLVCVSKLTRGNLTKMIFCENILDGDDCWCPESCERNLPPQPNYEAPGKRIAEQKCEEYVWEINRKLQDQQNDKDCLRDSRKEKCMIVEGAVIGGRDAKKEEFPHMGGVGWKTVVGDWIFLCGSSLISPKFVLTAAHCSHAGDDSRLQDPAPKIVRFGTTNIKVDMPLHTKGAIQINKYHKWSVVNKNIIKIIAHDDYKAVEKYNDIALLELDESLNFGGRIRPACLWPRFTTELIGPKVTATGWGVVESHNTDNSALLQVVNIDIVEFSKCGQLLKSHSVRNWSGRLRNTQICAGKLSGGVDTCQGDSGGPLQVEIPLNDKSQGHMHYVIGVTSFGVGCGLNNTPGVYTRVAPYLDWIESHVWK